MQNSASSVTIDENLSNIARRIPEQITLVKLSKTQMKVFLEIKRGELITPNDIADCCELSPAWASTILRRLYEKTYLDRRAESTQSGGLTYVYQKW